MSVTELLTQLEPHVFEKWKMIATLLGLFKHIALISKNHRDECGDCFLEVVQLWKDNEPKPFTWTTIIEILQHKNVGKANIAKKMIKHLSSLK